jgi:hypothetical protein
MRLLFLKVICQSDQFLRQMNLARGFQDVAQFTAFARSDPSHGSTMTANHFESAFEFPEGRLVFA